MLRQASSPSGQLSVAPLSLDACGPAALLVARAFAGSAERQSLASVTEYTRHMLEALPKAVLLVAQMIPSDPSRLPEGRESRLVGAAGLSFHRDTREEFRTLQPPDAAVYLSNMAVDPSFRREGIARQMLVACEALCRDAGFGELMLHARVADEAALALYSSCGFQEVARDGIMVALQGVRPRVLMRKLLN